MSIDNNEILKNKARNTRKKSDGSKAKKVIQMAATTVLLGSAIIPLVAVQTAHAAPAAGTLEVLDSQGVLITSASAAAGELLTIKVTDTDSGDNYLNKDNALVESFAVVVASPDDVRSPITISLTETTASSGIFTGTLELVDPSNGSPSANQIRVSNTHTVSVLDSGYNGAHPLVQIVQSITRKDHVTGAFRILDGNTSGAVISKLVNQNQLVYVELTDNDLNSNGIAVDTVNVNVTTSAGVTGQTLLLTETAVNSGVFSGLLTVNGTVAPANLDTFYIEYADAKNSNNSLEKITKSLTRKDYSAATLVLSTPHVIGKAAYDEAITVTLTDADLADANPSATTTVSLTSPDDTSRSLTLTQSGAESGVYVGSFTLYDLTHASAAAQKIKVSNGSSVAVSYSDLRDSTGSISAVTQTVQRKDHGTTVLSFDKSFVVVGDLVTVTLDDSDQVDGISGATTTVDVTTATYTTPIPVTLTETNDTGIYKGTFVISGTTANAGTTPPVVHAANADVVTATYTDAFSNTNGTNQVITTTLMRKDRVTGAFNAVTRTVTATGERIEISLSDSDVNTNPLTVQTVSVSVGSILDVTGFSVLLTETGINTGIFKGTFDIAGATNTGVTPNVIGVGSYNDDVTVTYVDANRANGTPGIVTQAVKWLQVPAITSITAAEAGVNENGVGAGDTVTIVFDMATNQPTIIPANIASYFPLANGKSWGTNGLAAAWSNSTTLVITVGSDAILYKNDTLSISASAGIQDAAGASAVSISHNVIGGTFGQTTLAISATNATYTSSTYRQDGQTFDISFNAPTNKQPGDIVPFNNLSLSAHSLGTNGSAVWLNNTTIRVTLGTGATARIGDSVIYNTTGEGLFDRSLETAAPASFNAPLAGSFGSKSPVYQTAAAIEVGSLVGPNAGDKIELTFDTPTNKPVINIGTDVTVTAGNTFTNVSRTLTHAVPTWNTAGTILTITLGVGDVVYKGDTINLDYNNLALFNTGGEGRAPAAIVSQAISGSFLAATAANTVTVLTAVYGSSTYRQAGQTFDITFNHTTNKVNGDTATFGSLSVNNGHTLGSLGSAIWQDATTLRVTLGAGATVNVGDTVTYNTTSENIADPSLENKVVSPLQGMINGSFGSKTPALNALAGLGQTGVDAANAGSAVGVQAGDTITVYFDTPTNQAITGANVAANVLVNNGLGSLGNGALVTWTNPQTMVITLGGTGINVNKGENLTVSLSVLKNTGGEGGAGTITAVIGGTFGSGVVPTSFAATASYDASTYRQAGQTFDIVFDKATNKISGNTAKFDNFTVNNTHSLGTGGSAIWQNATTLRVTLGAGATARVNDIVTYSNTASDNLFDITGETAVNSSYAAAITGSFGSKSPVYQTAAAIEVGSLVGPNAGDKIELTFDTPTNKPVINIGTDVTVTAGNTFTNVSRTLTHAVPTWNTAGTILTITLGVGDVVYKGDTINLDYNNLALFNTGGEGRAPAAIVSQAISGSFLAATAANTVTVLTAVYGSSTYRQAGQTFDITFNHTTNKVNGDTATFGSLSVNNGHTLGSLGSAIWQDATTLRVTLGAGATVNVGDTVTYNTTSENIADPSLENKVVSPLQGMINGSFGSKTPALNALAGLGQTGVDAANAGSAVGVQAGDTITVYFDTPTNQAITGANVAANVLVNNGLGSLGNGALVTWTNPQTMVITLGGTGINVNKGENLTVSLSVLKNTGGEGGAGTITAVIGGTFGSGVVPTSFAATASYDASTYRQAGQTFDIVFDKATNKISGNTAKFDNFTVNNTHSLGTGGSAIWQNATTLRVTLGAGATARVNDIVTYSNTASDNLFDITGETAVNSSYAAAITGSFGSKSPVYQTAAAIEVGSLVGPNAGDKIELTFDTPTNKPVINIGTDVTVTAGNTFTNVSRTLTHAVPIWNTTGTILTITLGVGDVVYKGDTINLDYNNLALFNTGGEGRAPAAIVSQAIGGSFLAATAANTVTVLTAVYDSSTYRQAGQTFDITFNHTTNKVNGDTATFGSLSVNNGHTLGSLGSAIWQDATTLRVTLGAGATVNVGDTVTYNTTSENIADPSLENKVVSPLQGMINGSFGSKTPALSASPGLGQTGVNAAKGSATVGAHSNDTITVHFDTPTNTAIDTVTLSTYVKVNKVLGSLGSGASVAWTNPQTMVITLGGTGINVNKGDTLSVLLTGLKNTGGEGGSGTLTAVIDGTFGVGNVPAIVSIQGVNANGTPGAATGDQIIVNFNTITNKPMVDLTNFTLDNGGTLGNATSSWNTTGDQLTITLGTTTIVSVNDILTINSGAGIKDVSGESAAMSGSAVITGTFGAVTAPQITNVTALNGDGTANIAAGDQIQITFANAVNPTTFNLGAITVTGGAHNFGVTDVTYAWSQGNTILTITLGSNPTIRITDTLDIASGSKIYDLSGFAELAAVTNLAIGGNFGVAVAPLVSSVTAINGDGTANIAANDQIQIVFNSPVDHSSFVQNQLTAGSLGLFGTGAVYTWTATSLTITLGSNPTITASDSLVFGATGITDLSKQAALVGVSKTISGNFGVGIVPHVASITAVNANGSAKVGGDKIIFVFDSPVSHTHFVESSITASNGVLDTSPLSFDWSKPGILTITLGSNATIQNGATISINGAASGIQDETGTVYLADVNAKSIAGSFGVAVAPILKTITAVNANGTPGLSLRNQLVFEFDVATNGTIAPILSISNGHNLGVTGATYGWSNGNQTLTVTLSAYATIKDTDYISLVTGNGIMDAGGLIEVTTASPVAINGRYISATPPKLRNASALNSNGTAYAGEGDLIVLVFDTAVSSANAFDYTKIKTSSGNTFGKASYNWSPDGYVLTITLGTNASVLKTDSIIIEAGSNIKDTVSNTAEILPSTVSISGSFGEPDAPRVLNVIASSADLTGTNLAAKVGDKITITFNQPTNQGGSVVDMSNFTSNDHSFGTGATAIWSTDGTKLVITLGTSPTILLTDTIGISSALNIRDSQANSTPTSYSVLLKGSFDGRSFSIHSGSISTAGSSLTASLSITPVNGHSSTEVILFELIDAEGAPVQVIAQSMDITGTQDLAYTFNNLSGALSGYTVKVFVVDMFDTSITTPTVSHILAQTLSIIQN